jgi:hypothetical protein
MAPRHGPTARRPDRHAEGRVSIHDVERQRQMRGGLVEAEIVEILEQRAAAEIGLKNGFAMFGRFAVEG